ncbi:4'-phosphopantetheinyl transferase [Pseudonocardia thermophila]|uniref:4'-phosphopantetheinyl transferase n=1 Tax=Pseudonocardia thermophila TaxID=1848 RepID=A0A1M6W0B7_PSETH|nr:4'-phosphopantetheinyl transferase superfamily protein [Pseudonocardia thermophila]SHK87036.1 4'-phosphopantetheinyl transferase [Pseudonocardia thermophila]
MGTPAATCRIFWAAPVEPTSAPHLVRLLDAHERERMARLRRPADQARYLAAHALTRVVLADVLGAPPDRLTFDRTCRCGRQHGKPVLLQPLAPAFSMTHAGDFVGVAVHTSPVGLDVEEIRPLSDLTAMAEHALSDTELAAGAGATPEGFFSVWTRKEAVLKATGDGLSVPMKSVTLGPGRVKEWTGDGDPGEPMWVHESSPAPGYVAAVAGFGTEPPAVVEQDGNALLR